MKLNITARDAISYAVLPRIIPRLNSIGFRFPFVASLMAMMYGWVGLLPFDHPYLNPANTGRYSVRQVFMEAAGNLRFRRTHIDQVIMFFLLLAGFLLLVGQFVMMAIYLLIGVAYASMFSTPDPTNDIAFILLDRVFGVPGFFNSCISTTATCDPTSTYLTPSEPAVYPEPYQLAMQALFGYYSMGMMMVGAAILCYFIFSVIMETVQTGVPFGQRFATAYAPIRLCLAVLALVPLPLGGTSAGANVIGYNAAQYLTLFAARAGSSLGTNMWYTFNNYFVIGGAGTGGAPAGYGALNTPATSAANTPAAELIARPKPANVDTLIQFMHIAHACAEMTKRMPVGSPTDSSGRLMEVKGYVIGRQGYAPLDAGLTYATALTISENSNIIMRFGIENPDTGDIDPMCGDLMLRVGDLNDPGPSWLLEQHFLLTKQMWLEPAIVKYGERISKILIMGNDEITSPSAACNVAMPGSYETLWGTDAGACDKEPNPAFVITTRDTYQATMNNNVTEARNRQIAVANSAIDPRILNRGWAGAGIWYNRLAELNGSLFEAVRGIPEIIAMPLAMEKVQKERMAAMEELTNKNRYTPVGQKGRGVVSAYSQIASALNIIYLYFQKDAFSIPGEGDKSGNPLFDLMNRMFGTKALFEMRTTNDINPLVQMIGLGKSIVDHTLMNLVGASFMEFAGGMGSQIGGLEGIGKGVVNVADAWFTVALLGLGIGIMLYYVIPFLPFIYFFFSVIKWLQSIFEAMVGVPLWALAHLRIDGDGIPGDAATDGYFLLFEIFLRPALTIFGMMASFVIFTAMVYTLNDIFDLATSNVTGGDSGLVKNGAGAWVEASATSKRGTVDQFFFTVLYALLVYIFATSSFKLIDRIPENILRWMGSGVKNIIDETGDPVPGMIRSVYIGAFGSPIVQRGGQIGQAVGAFRQGVHGLGELTGSTVQYVRDLSKGS